MNKLGSESQPFLFVIDYAMEMPMVLTPDEAKNRGIRYSIMESASTFEVPEVKLSKSPVSLNVYRKAFKTVYDQLIYGNSYLVNLTMPTEIDLNLTMEEIYSYSNAPFKLWIPDRFVVFSPERFVSISEGVISTYPMKGTIDASVPNARDKLMNDSKELAEHATIVDLLRNDLSMVSRNVKVQKYRYIQEVKTFNGMLLQVSSEITGQLVEDYLSNLGEIIFKLLPAGSVTGAPKEKTLEIIGHAESFERGYFTGVFGYFDGTRLDSAVMIRYIENTPKGYVYKSGGGITTQSELKNEYQELIDKVYVPIF